MDGGVDLSADELELYGLRPATEGGLLFCGVTQEQFAINGRTYRWARGSKLTWGLGFSRLGGLSDMDVKDAVTAALKEISDCCDVTHEYRSNVRVANLQIMQQRLDGPSGVLADCQIPPLDASPDDTTLLLRLDDSEAWGLFDNPPAGKIDLYRVILHELEHGHGLGHKPANVNEPALIAPIYSTQIRSLQPIDKAELVRRYGDAKSIPVPPAEPTLPSGAKPGVRVEVNLGGQVWVAEGNLKPKQ